MAEGSSAGPRRHSRVNWVALRTLRQLPKVVGENSAGEPIVEVRSVRLVLREGASHFSRVTTCSKCGREVPGAPVLGPADLDHPPHPVICRDCVRTASAPVLSPDRRAETVAQPAASPDAAPQSEGDRLAGLERRIGELAELVEGQRADLESALERRVDQTRVELRAFATKELARAQEDVDRMMKGVVERVGRTAAGADAGGAQAVEARLGRSIDRLTQRVDDQRTELVADIDARLAQLQTAIDDQAGRPASQVDELRTALEELARGQEELRNRLEVMAGSVGEGGERPRAEALEARLGERVEARLREVQTGVGTEVARIEAQLDGRLHDIGAQERERLATLEAQLQELRAGVQADPAQDPRMDQLETQLRELGAAVQAAMQRITEHVNERFAQVAELAAPEGQRLDGFEARLADLEGGLAAEAARTDGHLRDRLDEETALERQRLETLEADVARIADQLRERLDPMADEAAPDRGRLDDMEAQLRELQATIDEGTRRLEERLDASFAEAARVDDELAQRLDRQAERAGRAAGDDGRLEALEQRLEDAVSRMAALVESQRLEFQEDVRAGLAEARMAMAADERGGGRLKELEDAVAQRDAQLAELMELQTALDTGLGELRSEIEQLRETATRAAHVDSRLQTQVAPPRLPDVEPERGRRAGRKSADAMTALTAAVQGLLDDHRVFRAELTTLENEAETATRASARASAQATAVAPLRQDVRALREELAAQNEAVAALAKSVETLRRAARPKPAPKGATKPATKAATKPASKAPTKAPTKATKAATKAAKASPASKPTKPSSRA